MVDPEIAENTVPATTATTASRPGTCRTSRSTPSITFTARPVWNRTSPIRMKSGIGVSEKLATETTLFRASCVSPASPPRNSSAPARLITKNENATGRPRNSSTVEPPSISHAAAPHDIALSRSTRRHHAARAPRDTGGACGTASLRRPRCSMPARPCPGRCAHCAETRPRRSSGSARRSARRQRARARRAPCRTPPRAPRCSPSQQPSQMRPVLRARLDDARPAHLVRLLHVLAARLRIEADGLDAGLRLALGLVLVIRLPELVLSLLVERLAGKEIARRRRQRLPLVEVHDQRHLGVVEPRVDAELGLLLPVEIEQGVDRPAVAVDHAALERGVHLARRGCHHGCAHGLEEVAVHRRDADRQPGEVRLVDFR